MPALSSFPNGQRRQAHQDRVDVAAGLQAEQSAAVVEQVELDVAAAELEQPLHFFGGKWRRHALPDDLGEDVEECLADVAGEGEVGVEMPFEMVEENAADSARYLAVRQPEIF